MNLRHAALKSFPRRNPRSAGVAIAGAALLLASTSVIAVSGAPGVMGAGLALLMLAIAIIDSRHFIIPDELNAAGFALALANAAINGDMAVTAAGLAVLRGAAFASVLLGVRVGYRRLRGRDGLGLGDVKLAAVAGAWLDWLAMPIALEAAAASAVIFYVAHQTFSGQEIRGTSRLPFGLFFAPAIWLAWLVQASCLGPF
jgi:leader peptidase (prepilin peptidase) / N-methyltransferase